jgi:hypothetical protein
VRLLSMQLGAAHELPAPVVSAEQLVYRMMKGFKQ